MHRYGDTRVIGSVLRHVKGPVCAAIPKRDWELSISQIRLIAEFTTPSGPIFDYFFVFVAGDPPQMFQVPMESLEPVGLSTFFADLEAELQGALIHQLASSVSYASSIMWPEKLAREPLFVWVFAPRDSVVGRFIDRFAPRYHRALTESAAKFLGDSLEWAV